MDELIEGLAILRPKYHGDRGFSCAHDKFCAYSTDIPLSDHEVSRLWDLGWRQPYAEFGDPVDESERAYDPEEGWRIYC